MAHSISMTQVDAYQAYVQEFSDELMNIALQGFKTAPYLFHDTEVKGRKTYTVQKALTRVLKAFSTTYSAGAGQLDWIPRTLTTYMTKAELDITPSEIRGTYLGKFTLPNQEVLDPLLGNIVSYFLTKLATDIEELIWNGDTTGSGIMATFDGFGAQAAAAVTATDITAVATGAITSANVIASLDSVYDALDDAVKSSDQRLYCYTSKTVKDLYARAYRDAVTKYADGSVVTQIFGTNIEIVDVPPFASTSKVLIAPMMDMAVGYEGAAVPEIFIKREHYTIEHSVTPQFGALLIKPFDGQLAVNDQF